MFYRLKYLSCDPSTFLRRHGVEPVSLFAKWGARSTYMAHMFGLAIHQNVKGRARILPVHETNTRSSLARKNIRAYDSTTVRPVDEFSRRVRSVKCYYILANSLDNPHPIPFAVRFSSPSFPSRTPLRAIWHETVRQRFEDTSVDLNAVSIFTRIDQDASLLFL